MMSRETEIVKDKKDLLNQHLWILLLPIFIFYFYHTLSHNHNYVETTDPIDSTKYISYISSDVGLSMALKSYFPWLYLNLHWVSGFCGIILITLQKQLIYYYQTRITTRLDYQLFWKLHRYIGYAVFVLILSMDTFGYLMGIYSKWESFDYFSIFFAMPWPFLVVSSYLTAKFKQWKYHRICTNILFKACITVPITRIVGSICQSNHIFGDNDDINYYKGIGYASLPTFVWQMYEIVHDLCLDQQKNSS